MCGNPLACAPLPQPEELEHGGEDAGHKRHRRIGRRLSAFRGDGGSRDRRRDDALGHRNFPLVFAWGQWGTPGARSVWGTNVERRVFEISPLSDRTGLKIAGDLDLHSAQELTAALRAFQGNGDVWLDMTEVTFIDSSGLTSILSFAHSRGENGKVVIVDPAAVIGPVFNIIGLDDHTSIEVRQSVTASAK